ncbi:hypothetical protein Tco_1556611 [Tanacetum coccineum]
MPPGSEGRGLVKDGDNCSINPYYKAALKERYWVPDEDETYDVERIRRGRPSHISEVDWDAQIAFWNDPKNLARVAQNKKKPGKVQGRMPTGIPIESLATREYPSQIHTFFLTHTVGGVFLNPEDKALYNEMWRLQGLGSNTPSGHGPLIDLLPPPPCKHSSDVAKAQKDEEAANETSEHCTGIDEPRDDEDEGKDGRMRTIVRRCSTKKNCRLIPGDMSPAGISKTKKLLKAYPGRHVFGERELVRELPLHYPSWRQMPPERKAGVVAKIGKAAFKERYWVPDEDGTYDVERIRRGRPSHISEIESSATREYPSLIHTFFLTHTVGGVFLNPEDKALYGLLFQHAPRVDLSNDIVHVIVCEGKQQGHIPGVDRVLPGQGTVIPPPPPCTHSSDVAKLKKSEKRLTKQVNMFMRLFRSDDKFSQMLNQFESQPEYGGGSGSGGYGDDEPRDDEDEGKDGEDEDDS